MSRFLFLCVLLLTMTLGGTCYNSTTDSGGTTPMLCFSSCSGGGSKQQSFTCQNENFGQHLANVAYKVFVAFSTAKSVGLYIGLLRNMAHSNIFVRLRGSELHLLTNGPFPLALLIVSIIMSVVPGFTALPLTTHTNSRLSPPVRGENSTQTGLIGSRAGRKHKHQNNDEGAGDGNENPKRRKVLKYHPEFSCGPCTLWVQTGCDPNLEGFHKSDVMRHAGNDADEMTAYMSVGTQISLTPDVYALRLDIDCFR